MPLSLPDALIAAKNLLADTDAWIMLAELDLDVTTRLANNLEDITWNGQTWYAFHFELDVLTETGEGDVPQAVVRVVNTDAFQLKVEAAGGGVDSAVKIYLVHTGNLNETNVPVWTLKITGAGLVNDWWNFTLGAPSPYDRMFPVDRIRKTVCRHKFRSTNCGYSGGETWCDKTLTRCRVLNNSDAFGGFPGVGSGAIIVKAA